MPIRTKTRDRAVALLKAIKIQDKVVANSTRLNKQDKASFQRGSTFPKDYINNGFKNEKLTAYDIKSLEHVFFTPWNEGIGSDVEIFWEKINQSKLPFQRKTPLRELLNTGRLRHVDQWIQLFKNFNDLQNSGVLKNQFSTKEMKRIKELLDSEVKKRFELVNKCLIKKKIPFHQYLKFGESMAFLENCKLSKKYFSKDELVEIYKIWGMD